MITFCIPIYNQDVSDLVDQIVKQGESLGIEFQILCFDDMSNSSYREINKDLGLKLNVNYTELSENVGRAKIRNKMSRLARYDFMVFLDGDSQITNDNFVSNYSELVKRQHVVYGGRIYPAKLTDKNRQLHYNYGRKVESAKLSKRLKNRYNSFMSNNFMVTAKVMHEYPFDESMTSYGYEDLEWAARLEKNNILIHHIDNPIVHLGMETNAEFVNKIEVSIGNLVQLYKDNKISNSRLISAYEKICSIGLKKPIISWISRKENIIKKKLVENRAGLITLQLYKLGLFVRAMDN